jgi:hypothetical protein
MRVGKARGKLMRILIKINEQLSKVALAAGQYAEGSST